MSIGKRDTIQMRKGPPCDCGKEYKKNPHCALTKQEFKDFYEDPRFEADTRWESKWAKAERHAVNKWLEAGTMVLRCEVCSENTCMRCADKAWTEKYGMVIRNADLMLIGVTKPSPGLTS
eukprot:gene5196-6636_t